MICCTSSITAILQTMKVPDAFANAILSETPYIYMLSICTFVWPTIPVIRCHVPCPFNCEFAYPNTNRTFALYIRQIDQRVPFPLEQLWFCLRKAKRIISFKGKKLQYYRIKYLHSSCIIFYCTWMCKHIYHYVWVCIPFLEASWNLCFTCQLNDIKCLPWCLK